MRENISLCSIDEKNCGEFNLFVFDNDNEKEEEKNNKYDQLIITKD